MVYSRDMLTKPLHLHWSMLVNTRRDHFRPDESRSSRIIDLMKIQSGEIEQKGDQLGAGSVLPSLPDLVDQRLDVEGVQPSAAASNDGYPVTYPPQMIAAVIVRLKNRHMRSRIIIFLVQYGKTRQAKWCIDVEWLRAPLLVVAW